MDVSDRKRAEEALRRSEGYLAKHRGLTGTGSWAWNVASNVVSTGHRKITACLASILKGVYRQTRRFISAFIQRI